MLNFVSASCSWSTGSYPNIIPSRHFLHYVTNIHPSYAIPHSLQKLQPLGQLSDCYSSIHHASIFTFMEFPIVCFRIHTWYIQQTSQISCNPLLISVALCTPHLTEHNPQSPHNSNYQIYRLCFVLPSFNSTRFSCCSHPHIIRLAGSKYVALVRPWPTRNIHVQSYGSTFSLLRREISVSAPLRPIFFSSFYFFDGLGLKLNTITSSFTLVLSYPRHFWISSLRQPLSSTSQTVTTTPLLAWVSKRFCFDFSIGFFFPLRLNCSF